MSSILKHLIRAVAAVVVILVICLLAVFLEWPANPGAVFIPRSDGDYLNAMWITVTRWRMQIRGAMAWIVLSIGHVWSKLRR